MLLEAEDRGRVVHQHVGVEHEQAALLTARARSRARAGSREVRLGWVTAPSPPRALRRRGPAPCTLRHSRRSYAAGVDQERAALDAHVLASVHALLFRITSNSLAHLLVLVGQQLEREFLLALNFSCDRDAVRGDAEHERAWPCLNAGVQVAEVLAFERAAGRHVLRIEIEHQLARPRHRQFPVLPPVARQAERRDLLAYGNGS